MKKAVLLFFLFTFHYSLFTVQAQCTAVSITTQPQNQNDSIPGAAHFNVTVAGTAPYNYYWYKNGVVVDSTINSASATNNYNTPPLSMADSNNTYYCVITNCLGLNSITSNVVHLLCMPVSISIQPLSQTFTAGTVTTISFSVTVNGTPPFTYRWYRNPNTLVKTTIDTIGHTSIYSFLANPVVFGMNGNAYHVVITNYCNGGGGIDTNQVLSNNAVMTVICPSISTPIATNSTNGNIICSGNVVHLNTSFVAGATYNWTGTGGFSSTLQNPTLPGSMMISNCDSKYIYFVTLTINGCTSAPGSTDFFVYPMPVITPPATTSMCSGGIVSYSSFVCLYGHFHNYTIYPPCIQVSSYFPYNSYSTGIIVGYDTLINTGTTPCTFNYVIEADNAQLCTVYSTTSMTVYPLPSLTVTSPSICLGQTASIIATGADTYNWGFGAYYSGIHNVNPNVTTTYTVIGESTHGCISAATSTVTVINNLPMVTVNSPTICAGQMATLTASGSTANYTWSAGLTSTGVSMATASPDSTTTFTAIGTNVCGSDTAFSTVTVNPIPTVSVNSTSICLGQTATLEANGGDAYTWSAGATPINTDSAIASPITTSTYTVTGTSNNCSSTAVSTVTVNSITNAITQTGDTLTSSQSGGTYQWYSCEIIGYVPIPGATNQSYITTTNGSYAVAVTLGNCVDTADCVLFYAVGENELGIGSEDLVIYPNPSGGTFTIESRIKNQESRVRICTVLGECVFQSTINNRQSTIDIRGFAKGIYFVEVATSSNKIIRKKIVIN